MTSDERSAWVPLEGDGSSGPRPTGRAPAAAAPRRIRLRRSRNPVLAALDGGGDVFQRRGRDVLVGTVLLITPMIALNLWATIVAYDRFDGSGLLVPGFGDDATTGVEEVTVLLALTLASLTAVVVGLFASALLFGERFGRPLGLGAALGTTARSLPAGIVAWLLGHWWLPLAVVVLVGTRPEELAGLLSVVLPLAMVLTAVLLFVVPVIVAERTGPLRALRRSWILARMRFGSAVVFVIGTTVLGGLLMAGLASLPLLLEQTGFVTFGDYTWLANGIAAQVGIVVIEPLIALATAQMYLEVRLDAEGMDLMLDADDAFGPRVPAA